MLRFPNRPNDFDFYCKEKRGGEEFKGGAAKLEGFLDLPGGTPRVRQIQKPFTFGHPGVSPEPLPAVFSVPCANEQSS